MTTRIRLWWEVLGLCRRVRAWLLALFLVASTARAFAFVAVGSGLKLLMNGAASGDTAAILVGAAASAAGYAGDSTLGDLARRARMRLVEEVALTRIEPEIMRICLELEQLDLLEDPAFLDRLTALKGKAWVIVDSALSAVESVALALRLASTGVLLGSVSPWLLLLVPSALAQARLDRLGSAGLAAAELRGAEDLRLQRELFDLCTGERNAADVHAWLLGEELKRRQSLAWQRVTALRVAARNRAAVHSFFGWTLTVTVYTGALIAAASSSGVSAGSVVLSIAVATQLRSVVEELLQRSTALGEYGLVLLPYLELRAIAAAERATRQNGLPSPARLERGISLCGVSYRYPHGTRPAVQDVTVHLPAGRVTALIGRYGSGKTTLIKLLLKLAQPGSGRILVDGVDLADLDTAGWRASSSVCFQDYARFQTSLRLAVGCASLPDAERDDVVHAALDEAGARSLAARVPGGLDGQLGTALGGTGLSDGQWQKTALARAFMRSGPILLVLDEPSASLDPDSEQAVHAAILARARRLAETSGAVTLLVSHQLALASDADMILLLDEGRLIEAGTHEELLARAGTYAELYRIQTGAFR